MSNPYQPEFHRWRVAIASQKGGSQAEYHGWQGLSSATEPTAVKTPSKYDGYDVRKTGLLHGIISQPENGFSGSVDKPSRTRDVIKIKRVSLSRKRCYVL
jgi:hypothetical protein